MKRKINIRLKVIYIYIMVVVFTLGMFPSPVYSDGPGERLYIVKKGDTLQKISRSVGVPMDDIIRLNGLKDKNIIYPGQSLRLSSTGQVNNSTQNNVTINIKGAALYDVLNMFSNIMDINIMLLENSSSKVNIELKDVPVYEAMEYVIQSQGMGYTRQNNVIIVGNYETLKKDFFLDMQITKFDLRYISSDALNEKIRQLSLPVEVIVVEGNLNSIWVQGTLESIEKVKELISKLDIPENIVSREQPSEIPTEGEN